MLCGSQLISFDLKLSHFETFQFGEIQCRRYDSSAISENCIADEETVNDSDGNRFGVSFEGN